VILSTENSGTLPWVLSDDKSVWTAPLPDGRTAMIERLDDDESFLPRVADAVGPVCDGVLAAAQWAAEWAARPAPCSLCGLRAERGVEPPPGGCTCQAAQDAR
jgi:hypothetical protein